MATDQHFLLENELCPHFNDVDEDLMERLSSKVAAVRASEEYEDLFHFTHRRIQVYQYGSEEVYDETEIYQQFDEHRLGNFVVVIRGPTGTGKSELCWTLSHRLRNEGRSVLHIDKNADLMSIMAEEIPDFYERHTGEQIQGAKEVDRLRKDIREEKETVARYAVSKAIIDLRDSDVDVVVDNSDRIEEFVGTKLTDLVKQGVYDSDVDFVSENEVRNFDYLDILPGQSAADTATMLTDTLWNAIRSHYESPSLDSLLEEVGQAFTDTRPVIIFEDWSVTSLDAIRLRDYMERDNDNDRWDFIVAGTPDSFEELEFRTQTSEDRFQFYETTKEGEDQVLFLDADSAVDFIRPYLGYIKWLDGSVTYDRDAANRVTAINKPEPGSRCASCEFCDPEYRDLFPFNRTFIERVYTGLPTDDQQPRKYVQTIFAILEEYYDSDEDVLPPSSSGELSSLTNDVDLADSVYINPELANLAEWYGTVDEQEGVVTVDRRFPVAFGIDQTVEYEEYNITVDDTELRFPTINGGRTLGGSGTESGGTGESGEGTTLSPEEERIQELRPRVENWREAPGEWTEVNVYLRQGLRDAIERLTDGFKLWSDAPLEYRVGSGNPFVTGDEIGDPDQIHINQKDFVQSDLLDLLEFGVMRSEDPRNADYKSFLDGTGTQITEYAQSWRSNLQTRQLEKGKFFRSGTEYSLAEVAYSGYVMCVLLDDPWEPLTTDRISSAFTDDRSLSLDDDLSEALDDQLNRDDYNHIQSLFEHASEYEDLFEDEFAFTSNSVDHLYLETFVENVSPFDVANKLVKSRINRVSGKVKFSSSNKNLTTVLKGLYFVDNSLESLSELDVMVERAEHITRELDGVDMQHVQSITTDIKETYSDVLSGSQESLVKFANESQTDVNAMYDASARFLTLRESQDVLDQMLSLLVGLKLLENQTVERYEDARDFDLSSHDEGGLGEDFMEVSDVLF